MTILKYIKSILIGVILGIIILFISISTYFYINRGEIKTILVKEINKSITTQIEVKSIKLNFTDRFPKATLDLDHIYIKSKNITNTNFNDTLLTADNVYLDIDLSTLISGKPIIKTININNGKINIFTDHNGKTNYLIFKNQDNKNTSFKIENIQLKNTSIRYCKIGEYNFAIKHISGKVKLKEEQNTLKISTKLDAKIKNAIFKNYKIKDENLKLNCKLEYNKTTIKWISQTNIFSTELSSTGQYNFADKTLTVKLDKIEINKKTLHKLNLTQNLLKYTSYDFKLKINNTKLSYSAKNKLNIEFNWKLSNKLNYKSILTSEIGTGKLVYSTNYKMIKIENLNINSAKTKTHFSGSYILPSNKLSGQLTFISDLAEFKKLIIIPKTTNISGKVKGTAAINTKLNKNSFNFPKQVNIKLTDVNFIYDKKYKIQKLNSTLTLNNHEAVITKLETLLNNNRIKFSGKIQNIETNKTPKITGKLKSDKLNLNNLLYQETTDTLNNRAKQNDLNFDLTLYIKNLKYKKIEASEIKGKISKQDKRINIHNVRLQTADGKINIDKGILMPQKNKEWYINIEGKTQQININKLFIELDNFQQNYITYKNIYGKLTSKFYTELVFDQCFNIKPSSIFLKSNIDIKSGKLTEYKPLQALSKFINIKELKNIDFSELKNTITINNSTIHIPSMQINSSAINIELKGNHTFNGTINYEVKVALNEILYARFKRLKKRNYTEKSGNKTAIILGITGLLDNPTIKFKKLSTIKKSKTRKKPTKKIKKFQLDISDI